MAAFTVKEEDIRLPVNFPNPVISPCQTLRGRVLLTAENNRIVERTIIQTPGNFYELGRVLKETIYGYVYHAVVVELTHGDMFVRRNPVQPVAIKAYFRDRLRSLGAQTQENPKTEIAAMQFIKEEGGNANVMTQIECCVNTEHVYQIMEFCDGDELYDVIEAEGAPFDEERARHCFRQILNGTRFLHSHHISHRDMSLENVMMYRNGTCKIIDMGMCLKVAATEDGQEILCPFQGICGKKNYIAPEIFDRKGIILQYIVYCFIYRIINYVIHYKGRRGLSLLTGDVWALGVMLFILVTGVPPVEAAIEVDPRFRMIRDGELGNMLHQWNITTLSDECVDLLTCILQADPDRRFTLDQIEAHAWMAAGGVDDEAVEMRADDEA